MPQKNSPSPSGRRPSTPKYCHHTPSGQAYVTLNGRQVYLGAHGSPESRAEYDRLVGEYLINGRLTGAGDAGISVNELLVAYLHWARTYYPSEGKRTCEYDEIRLAIRELKRLYGLTPANEFGPLGLKAIQKALIDQKLTRQGVNRRTSRIVRAFKWGVQNELVAPMVHHALSQVPGLKRGRTTAPEAERTGPVDDERVDAVKPHVSRQVWAMIELQRLTGMRSGEVCQMRSGDIDRTGNVWVYSPLHHKTEHHGHSRSVYLGPKAQAVLQEWLKEKPEAFLFSPAEAEKERKAKLRAARKTKVQPSQKDRRKANPKMKPRDCYDTATYYRAIQRACDLAEVKRWHPHQLRHSAATVIRKRFGVEAASILLGHREVGVTQIYAERDEKRAIEVAGEIG
jgi:integrase